MYAAVGLGINIVVLEISLTIPKPFFLLLFIFP